MKKRFSKGMALIAMAVVFCLVPSMGFSLGESQGYSIDFTQSSGYGVSDPIQFRINDIRLDMKIQNPLTGELMISSSYFDIMWELDYGTVSLVPVGIPSADEAAWTPSTLTLEVTDALTGAVIPNASVIFEQNSIYADYYGMVEIDDIMSGNIMVTVNADGYIAQDLNFEIASGDSMYQGVALMPENNVGALRGDIRIVLNWGEDPRDLDSHLTGPRIGSADRFHVYYADKNSSTDWSTGENVLYDASIPAMLDVDDVSSYGPETITIVRGDTGFAAGVYRYTVHHYSGDSDIMNSGATVNIFQGEQLIRTYTPPQTSGYYATLAEDLTTAIDSSYSDYYDYYDSYTEEGAYTGGSGDIWTVVELTVFNDGSVSIAPVNTYGSVSYSGSIQSAGSYLGVPVQPESSELFRNLPAK